MNFSFPTKQGSYSCTCPVESEGDPKIEDGCSCSPGYEGNPYIHGGCTDIDECENSTLCHGNCTNLQDSYSCICPVGSEGNPKIKNGCRPLTQQQKNSDIPVFVIIIVGKCGNMSISYPFGIKNGCFREGFQIKCNETSSTASTIDGIEIIDISISQTQMCVYNRIGFSCNFTKLEDDVSYTSHLGIGDRRYRFSNTRNKFTAVGCQTFATLFDPYTRDHYAPYSDFTATGCLSLCTNQSRFANNSICSGVGCCQTPIPEGLSYYQIYFDPGFLNNDIWDYSPCNYAFVAEEGFYGFLQSDIEQGNLLKRFEQAPVVLDWVVGNETCKEARLNKSEDYACVSLKSTCKDSQNGPGYTCSCSPGYEGNPYIHGGCIDIDECKNSTLSQCYGNCTNLQGSYSCVCPPGYEGNPKIKDGCKPQTRQ